VDIPVVNEARDLHIHLPRKFVAEQTVFLLTHAGHTATIFVVEAVPIRTGQLLGYAWHGDS
jgi:Na+-translocating ferredoxin:NAD+ oxidoreductase RnfC subunit